MTLDTLAISLIHAAVGAAAALAVMKRIAPGVPERLIRTNVNDRRVPAVLGMAVVLAGLLSLVLLLTLGSRGLCCGIPAVWWAAGAIALVLGSAGLWDDLRGRELPRGFAGHLAAAKGGRVTGGLVKLVAGGAVGVSAGLLVGQGRAVIETALLVALTANLVNLLDRAPGRAGKVVLAIGVPLVALGNSLWAVSVVGFLGAVAAVLALDLRERAMLGDAGANPLGGLLGLGLAVSLGPTARLICVVALVGLNLASEWRSFSEVIAGNAVLNRLDMLGRKQQP